MITKAWQLLFTLVFAFASSAAFAASASMLDDDAQAALQSLYANHPGAKSLGQTARGILVFPKVTRAGFIVGGQGGEGTLFEKGKPTAHYSTGAASIGLQAGIQSYGYALFFMSDEDLNYLKKSSGWEIGVGPTVVIADAGFGRDASTLTGRKGVYGFIFDQKGLMAGMGLSGQKITKLSK